MKNNKKIIIANWKMNPASLKEGVKLLSDISKHVSSLENSEIVICPPSLFVISLMDQFSNFKFGLQNVFWHDKGAFTGEISAAMAKKSNIGYVIVGHSERREYLKETDEVINLKIKACLRNKIKPVVCIGETNRNDDQAIEYQLSAALTGIKKSQLKDIIIVYEPVWAISTHSQGVAAMPDDTFKGLILIKKALAKKFNIKNFFDPRNWVGKTSVATILYGGSVNSKNVSTFTSKIGFDGVLVGNASLNYREFSNLCLSV